MNNKIGNRFDVEKRLGSGSFGEVFLGKDSVTGMVISIFVLELLTQRTNFQYLRFYRQSSCNKNRKIKFTTSSTTLRKQNV